MFRWLNKKKEERENMATLDERELKKAKEDVKEKGADSQSEKDRENESVGEQERLSGNENSQDAKDREDESKGTKRFDEERSKRIEDKLDKLIDLMISREERKAERDADALKDAKEKYGVGNSVFEDREEKKEVGAREAAEILRKIRP